MKTVFFRNVFIDTEVNAIGNGQISRIQFPPTAFSIRPNQMMKLVLTSFELRRNWYSVNQTNNTFYIFNPALTTYTQVTIAPGSYRAFDGVNGLAPAIEAAVNAALGVATTTVGWNAVTRKFTITAPAMVAGSYFVCFQVKQAPPNPDPAVISSSGYFNDIAEILGAKPTRDNWTVPVNAFGTTTGVTPHVSPYVGALNTIETIFLRTNTQTNNYQSIGFEQNLSNQSGLTSSSIFARIPLSRAYYNDEFEIIQFEDTNDLFTILLQQTQINDIIFSVSDHAGRPLSEVSKGQSQDGNLSFKLSLRWEVVEQDTPVGEYRIKQPTLSSQKVVP